MMTDASESWVDPIFDAVKSHALSSGWFDRVEGSEPTSPPNNGLTAALWVQSIEPTQLSGLKAVSATLRFNLRIYSSLSTTEPDSIDPNVLKACSNLMRAYHDDFDFGGLIRNVDLLGSTGLPLSAEAGYVEIGDAPVFEVGSGVTFRVMTLTIPCIVNDVWPIGPGGGS